jgi:hypothetical protein
VSRDQCIDQSGTSIHSLLNTNGASFLMTSHVRSALWTLTYNFLRLSHLWCDLNFWVWRSRVDFFHIFCAQSTVPPIPCPKLTDQFSTSHVLQTKLFQNPKNPKVHPLAFTLLQSELLPTGSAACQALGYAPWSKYCLNPFDIECLLKDPVK